MTWLMYLILESMLKSQKSPKSWVFILEKYENTFEISDLLWKVYGKVKMFGLYFIRLLCICKFMQLLYNQWNTWTWTLHAYGSLPTCCFSHTRQKYVDHDKTEYFQVKAYESNPKVQNKHTSELCQSKYKWAAAWQNQHNDLCTQQRLRSAWASTQSDQSFRSALKERLRTQGFFMRTGKTLIRLGRCPGWSEYSLGTQVILLVLSCCGSNILLLKQNWRI